MLHDITSSQTFITLGDNDSPLTNHGSTPATGEFHPCSNLPPLGDPFPGPTAIISWWGIALGFPKPQCRRVSPSLTLSRHLYFLATPRFTTAPSSGTLTLWRHNCMASWRKMRRQGETWQRLWILEFQVSLRYCSSQPVDVHLRSFCRTPNHYLNQCWFIVNWTLRNKFQWNSNPNSKHKTFHSRKGI